MLEKTPSPEMLKRLEEVEKTLNVVSITIFRQLAEMEATREKKMKKESPKKNTGWFGGWLGGWSSTSSTESSPDSILLRNPLDELMGKGEDREREMQKLYASIGYTENEVITPYSSDYIAIVLSFQLNKLSLKFVDDALEDPINIMLFSLNCIHADIAQRPSSKGLRVLLTVEQMKLLGTPQGNKLPTLIRSHYQAQGDGLSPPLVDLSFEMNPLDKDVDQSITMVSQPLEMVFDEKSVNSIVKFTEPPEEQILRNLQEKAFLTFEDLKISSTSGLLYAMEQQNVMDVDIHLNASYLIIPKKGSYFDCNELLVIDFGSLHLKSEGLRDRQSFNLKADKTAAEIQENAYDRFVVDLSSLQVLICWEGEDFQTARLEGSSSCHVLHPVGFHGKLIKAIVPEDTRLTQFSISGELPSLQVTLSDGKVSRIVQLFESLTLPWWQEKDDALALAHATTDAPDYQTYHKIEVIPEEIDVFNPESVEYELEKDESSSTLLSRSESALVEYYTGIANQVTLELNFKVKKLALCVALTNKELNTENDCLYVSIDNVSCDFQMRRWDMSCDAKIGYFELLQHGESGEESMKLLHTEKDSEMLSLCYRSCGFSDVLNLEASYINSSEYQIRSCQYRDEFGCVEQYVKVDVAMMYVKLHQEALLKMMEVIYQVIEPLSKTQIGAQDDDEDTADNSPEHRWKGSTASLQRRLSTSSNALKRRLSTASESLPHFITSTHEKEKKKISKKNCLTRESIGVSEGISWKVVADMAGLDVHVCSEKVNLAQATMSGFSAYVEQYDDHLELEAHMTDLQLHDRKESTKYPNIIIMESDEVFSLKFKMFESGSKGNYLLDMEAYDTSTQLVFGQMRAVLLNRFINDIFQFMSHFEEAQQAIAEAGAAARDKAVNVVQDVAQHSDRHKLDLTLHAPTIIMPADSNSTMTLFFYLGKLHLVNKFDVIVDEKSTTKDYIITDNINISLTNLKVSKALLIDHISSATTQRDFIDPVELDLKIVRNLTFEYHLIPDFSIEGVLKNITIYLSQEEPTVIMKILKENYSEGVEFAPPASPKKKEKKSESVGVVSTTTASITERRKSRFVPAESVEVIVSEVTAESASTYITTSFTFDWDKVVLKIYQKPQDITLEEEFIERDEEYALCEFTIGQLYVSGEIISNTRMDVNVLLKTLSIDDRRKKTRTYEQLGRKFNHRMIDHCPRPILQKQGKEMDEDEENVNEVKSMLGVDYTMTESGDSLVKMKLCDFLCILNMEFIMALITTTLAMIPGEDLTTSESMGSLASSSFSVSSSGYEDSDSPLNMSNELENEEIVSHSEIKLVFELENPQIVLLADASDPKTHGLFLSMHTNFQYFYLKQVQKMVMNINNISVLSTAFHEENRHDISNVLLMDAIDFFSSSPINGKPHMNVSMTEVNLNVSPLTINTIMESVSLAMQYKTMEDEQENEKTLGTLWDLNDITESKAWYLDTPPQHVLSAGSFVLARNEDNTYKNGFLSKKDTHYTVFFYPEGQISHSVSDVTSVAVDMVPSEDMITVGANVLGMYAEVGYKVGRVIRIWSSNKTLRSADNSPQHGWEITQGDGSVENKYLIRFYHNDAEFYLTHLHIRLLPLPLKGVVPGIGACVYARYNDGSYYRGIVKAINGYQTEVFLDDFDEKIAHDRDDTAAVIHNLAPQEVQVKKLFKVIAKKTKTGKGFHPGKVLTIMGQSGNNTYYIKFEDGDTNQVPLSELRLMPKAPYDALPEIGSYVYSRIRKDSPLYEKGIVVERGERLLINHLSGRKISHAIENIAYVVRNIVPLNSSLRVGQSVIAQVDNDEMTMSTGEIREVILGQKFKKYLVQFSDGSERKLTAGRIRILSTYGDIQTKSMEDTNTLQIRKEQLVFEVERITLNLQGYLGGTLTPFLKFNSKVSAQVFDWSTKLNGIVNCSIHGDYYNDQVAEWEPLLEPLTEGNHVRDWALTLQYTTEDDDIQNSESVSDQNALLQKPITSIRFSSADQLNLTLTEKSISMLQDLSASFSSADINSEVSSTQAQYDHQYTVFNHLGKSVTIQMNELLQDVNGERRVTLGTSTKAELDCKVCGSSDETTRSRRLPALSVQVEGYQEIKNIVVKRHRVVLYNLVPLNLLAGEPYTIVVKVEVVEGHRFVTIRSPLLIKNNFPIPLQVKCFNTGSNMTTLTQIEPHSQYAVPLVAAYYAKLHITPVSFSYEDSTEAFNWRTVSSQGNVKQLVCIHTDADCEPFFIQTVAEFESYTSVHGMLNDIPRYIVNCYPPIILHNYLPYVVVYKAKGMASEAALEGGMSSPLFNVSVDQRPVIDIRIDDYMGMSWKGSVVLSGTKGKTSRFIPMVMRAISDNRRLDLGLFQLQEGTLNVTFYSPYWMVNKTGQSLAYQDTSTESATRHPKEFLSPVMFQVKGKKKIARLSIHSCNWSDEFSLDAVGNDGCLESAGVRGRIYQIGVRINLSHFALTKIVTLTPLRMINNLCKFTISMAEADSESSEWATVKPNDSIPYWPAKLPPKNLYININGYESVQFTPEAGKTLLLRFQNEIGGICVTYQEKASSSLLTFDSYFPGAAAARIENMCKQTSMISYQQTGFLKGHVLLYGQSVIYTWDDPTLVQELNCGVIEHDESRTAIRLDKHDFGRMKAGRSMIYWVSFLDGIQRVLLFTDNFKAAYFASQEHMMRPEQELDINIESVGLSLVNTEKRVEVAYISISKSPIVWEYLRKSRMKKMENKMSEALEDGYNDYTSSKTVGKSTRVKVGSVEVDYDKMFITKPEKVKIQRIFHSGVEFKQTLFPNRMSITGSISTLQVDTHIPDCTFPTIIHVVEPPMSVARDNVQKPFIEYTFIAKLGEKGQINEVTYFKILVQEIDIRIDRLFLNALFLLVTPEGRDLSEMEKYKADTSFVRQSIESSPEYQATKQEKRYVFNYLHISPLQIHLSFSNIVSEDEDDTDGSMRGDIISLLLQSVGLVFTEIQGVEFKLACYELNSSLFSYSQLYDQVGETRLI